MKITKMELALVVLVSSMVSAAPSNVTSPPSSPAPLPPAAPPSAAPPCERAPAHAQPADGHYKLGVAGDPDLFLPGELYTVSLQGVDSGQGPNPFIGFTIWAEMSREATKNGKDEKASNFTEAGLGSFQAYDAQARIHDTCDPAVVNATGHPKTEIQVIWTAPAMTAGECIRLCARAGPAAAASDGWSLLARKLCAAPAAPASVARQPPIVEPCCACDEAKYEVTFEGLWSRNTHPREFPPESARAHFGDVIGASHTAQYRVWQEGRVASSGLRRLADDGATTALEKELKAESEHIRTIIKARGLSWQQPGVGGAASTFAVFRVDARHHLVSLAAKLAPSPDWLVGVSALELCAPNCTWTRSLTLPLYPYDAGTDNGLGYTSRRVPTIPAAPVRALRPDWPRDVRSPFFSTTGEMRPFARLRLTRLRLYEKSCDSGEYGEGGAGGAGACSTRAWGAWSACSVSCGLGTRVRQRDYVHAARAPDACRRELTQRTLCHGDRRDCRAPSEYEPAPSAAHGPCAVSAWSAWSPCEGCGVRARSRHYLAPRAAKRCHAGARQRSVLDQAVPCDAGPCERVPDQYVNMTNFDWFFIDTPADPSCRVSAWSAWSPCSARCGRGRRLRSRVFRARDARLQHHVARTLHRQLHARFAELQDIAVSPENITAEPEVSRLSEELFSRCQSTLTMQEALCDGDDGGCEDSLLPEESCKLPLAVGHCRGYQERWFFDPARGACEPFGFSGCGGNANNFRTEQLCRSNCLLRNHTDIPRTTPAPAPTETGSAKKLKPTPSNQVNEVLLNDAPVFQEEMECQKGPWLGWSQCYGDCEYAVKLNYRLVLRGPRGAGASRPCGRLVKSRACRPAHCRLDLPSVATTTPSPEDDDLWIDDESNPTES